jgi:hypothetical protein
MHIPLGINFAIRQMRGTETALICCQKNFPVGESELKIMCNDNCIMVWCCGADLFCIFIEISFLK